MDFVAGACGGNYFGGSLMCKCWRSGSPDVHNSALISHPLSHLTHLLISYLAQIHTSRSHLIR